MPNVKYVFNDLIKISACVVQTGQALAGNDI